MFLSSLEAYDYKLSCNSLLSEKNEKDGKSDNSKVSSNDKSNGTSSPALSTKSSDSEVTKDNKVVAVPVQKVTADSVRGKCRDMIVNSLVVQGDFEAGMAVNWN